MRRISRRAGLALLIAALGAVVAPPAGAAVLHIVAVPPVGSAGAQAPSFTMVADAMPAGYVPFGPSRWSSDGATAKLIDKTIGAELDLAVVVQPNFPVFAPGFPNQRPSVPAPIPAPPGAVVNEDGSWEATIGAVRGFGRWSTRAEGTRHVFVAVVAPGIDPDAPPEEISQVAAIAALRPSFDGWYGLDPATTSYDAALAADTARALAAATAKTRHLGEWLISYDYESRLSTPTQRRHLVAAARIAGGHYLAAYRTAPFGPRSWQNWLAGGQLWEWATQRQCLYHYPRRYPEPVLSLFSARAGLMYGPMAADLLADGNPAFWALGDAERLLASYDLTVKRPVHEAKGRTRYELLFYSGWRRRVIVVTDRAGRIVVMKMETQAFPGGRVIERRRLGISASVAENLLRPHGTLC